MSSPSLLLRNFLGPGLCRVQGYLQALACHWAGWEGRREAVGEGPGSLFCSQEAVMPLGWGRSQPGGKNGWPLKRWGRGFQTLADAESCLLICFALPTSAPRRQPSPHGLHQPPSLPPCGAGVGLDFRTLPGTEAGITALAAQPVGIISQGTQNTKI